MSLWTQYVVNEIETKFGKQYKYYLPTIAIKVPPYVGEEMELINNECIELSLLFDSLLTKKRKSNYIDFTNDEIIAENKKRMEYNKKINKINLCTGSFTFYNSLYRAFSSYLMNHNLLYIVHKHTCAKCGQLFFSKNTLFKHLSEFNHLMKNTTTYKCSLCKNEIFSDYEDYDLHYRFSHRHRIQ
jgi:DNA-directed RNA polymerase subunit RPC12/RpoP